MTNDLGITLVCNEQCVHWLAADLTVIVLDQPCDSRSILSLTLVCTGAVQQLPTTTTSHHKNHDWLDPEVPRDEVHRLWSVSPGDDQGWTRDMIEYAHHAPKSPDCPTTTSKMWTTDGYISLTSLISHGLEAPGIDKCILECKKCDFKCHGCHVMEPGGSRMSTGFQPERHADGSLKPLAKQQGAGF